MLIYDDDRHKMWKVLSYTTDRSIKWYTFPGQNIVAVNQESFKKFTFFESDSISRKRF